jgi:hypothetical protein
MYRPGLFANVKNHRPADSAVRLRLAFASSLLYFRFFTLLW